MYSHLQSRVNSSATIDISEEHLESLMGEPNGLATLDENGMLNEDQLPDNTKNNTFTAISQPQQLALPIFPDTRSVYTGSICVRTDENKSYICIKDYDGSQSVATFTDYWQELLTPISDVTSVAGRDGDIILTISDITDITATAEELNYCDGVTSNIQEQLDAKTTSLLDDTTPQLGGDLDTNGHNIDGITPTEISYLDGVTSNIQTQLNVKDALSIKGRTVDDSAIGDQRVIGYDLATDTLKYLSGGDVLADESWTAAGDLVAGKAVGKGVILNSSGTNDDVLVVDSTQISGLNWKSLSELIGVENDLIWDAKGDLAVGVGINKAINLKSGTTGQILSVDSTKITGLAWVDETTIATDPIWDTGAKGSLAVKTAEGVTLLPVGVDDYILTSDSTEQPGLKWKALTEVFNILTDDNWTSKGEIVVGTGVDSAEIVPVGIDNYILTADSAESSGVKWVNPTEVLYNDIWTATGDMIYADDSIEGVRLPIGAENQQLTVSATGKPYWKTPDIIHWEAKGDLIVGDGVDSADILTIGDNGDVLVVDNTDPLGISWQHLESVFSVANDNIWSVAGEILVGTGLNTSETLSIGNENQVLSVKSGEVSWADLPDSAYKTIENDTVWSSKGDIVVATGNDVATILPLGTQGETLIVDTRKPLGMKWANAQTGNSIQYDLLWGAKGDLVIGVAENEGTNLPIGVDGHILSVDANADNYIGWREEIKSAPLWTNTGNGETSIREQIALGRAYNVWVEGTPTGHWEEVRTARSLTAGTNGTCLMVNKSSYDEYPTVRWADPLRHSNIWSGRYNLLVGHSSNIYGDPDTRTAEILPIGKVNQHLTVKWHDGGQYGVSYKYLDYAYSPALSSLTNKGDILIASSANTADRLPIGAANYVLTSDPSAPNLVSWKNARDPVSVLADDAWTTKGQIAVATGDNTAVLVEKGTQGQVLTVDNIQSSGVKWTTKPTLATDDLWYLPGDLVIGTGEGTATRFPASPNYSYVLISDPTDPNKLRWTDPRYIMSVVDDNVWDAKGDLVVGTGIDTGEKLSVGIDGQVLIADSLESGGIKWGTIGTTSDDTEFTPNGDITSTTVQDAIVEVRDDTDTKLSLKADISHISAIDNPHSVSAVQVGNATAQWNADRIKDIVVDDSEKANNKVLVYDEAKTALVYREFNEILSTGHSGDILYHNGTEWVKLNKGIDEQVLTLISGFPAWEDATGGGSVGDVISLPEQTSTQETPLAGYGKLYSKTDGSIYYLNDEGTETRLDVSGSGNIIQTITLNYTDFTANEITLSYSLPDEKSISLCGAKVTSAFAATTDIEVKTDDDKRLFFGRILADTPGEAQLSSSNSYMNLTGSPKSLKLVVSGFGGGSWSTDSAWNLNTARQGLAGCGTQSSALSFGGGSITEKFNGVSWSTNSAWNLNTARQGLAGCGTQSSALSFGGYTSFAITEKFNGVSWSTNSAWDLNTARGYLAGCGTQSSALSFGGYTSSNVSVTEKFNGVSWSTNSAWNLNTARQGLAGCGTQSSALSFGGYTSFAITEKFNGVSWSTNSAWDLNTARGYLAGCGTQSSALSFGGYTSSNVSVTEKFNGVSWSTNSAWNLNTARRGLAGCGTQSSALSFGGYTSSNVSVTEKFTAFTNLTQGQLQIKLVVI